jgi:Major Facilitator Superfamily
MSARVGPRAGFWFVACAFAVVMAFGTVPSPLWPLYGLSSTLVTVAFATMVIGVGTGLYFMGHLSDRFGRRRIVLPALVIALAAAATMAVWHQLPGLLIGRVLTGVAAGLMASTATTYLTELRPASPRLSSGVAAAANLGGLALGPLVAGALAQWAAHPLVTPYAVFAVLMALGLLGVALTPETVERGRGGRDARFQLRAGRGGAFAGAAAVAFCSFAIFGLFASLGSVIVRGELHNPSRWTWGLAAFVVLGVSAVAQVAFSRVSVSRLLAIGLAGAPVGFVLVVIALYHPSLALYLIGSALAGAGAGLLFKAGIGTAIAAADPTARAGVLSAFFVIAYLGMAVPPVLLAVATHFTSQRAAMIGFGCAIAAISVIAAGIQTSAARVPQPAG